MAEDREILSKVWEGRVPACITLAVDDLIIGENLEPQYLMLPRISYFTVALDKVQKSFQKYISPDLKNNEFWIDYKGTPLKMQFPIGVLCDMHNRESETPWNLTLHFSSLPSQLLSFPTRESIESQFLSYVKEADALKHRGKVLQTLGMKDRKQLWQGLITDKFSQFLGINQKLMDSSGSMAFRNIPFRLHGLPAPTDSSVLLPAVMRLQKPFTDDNQPLLLSHLIEDTLADLIKPDDVLVVQGVVLPRDTPLLWMSQHLSCPDNFLHFCVRRPAFDAAAAAVTVN
uniref:Autophagy protein 5 n=2 Tax=Hirondellea gigas TaxID=1518452 RepID=A0A6A7FTN3_9CRUS